MKFVNWRYPDAKVIVQFLPGPIEKDIQRAIGLIVGQNFIGWMKTRPQARQGKL